MRLLCLFLLLFPLFAFFLHIAAVVLGFLCPSAFLFGYRGDFFLRQFHFLVWDFHLAHEVKENLNFLCAACPFALRLVDKDFFNKLIYHGGGKLGKICVPLHKSDKLFRIDALAADRPPILVLDEPTSNLDISAIRELREIVAKWKATGKTVLIAEHRLWWLRGLVDRVAVFQEGSIVEDVPADEFWRRTPDELHAEGLRGSCRFAPQVKEHRADAQYIISPFRSSDGEFTLNIPELKIPKGAVVAVLGNNGAGKSTFARCLCGLVRKCKVQIIDGEKRYAGRKLSSLAYMVFQDVNHQLFSESVSEDVTLGLRLSEDEKRSTAEEMLWRMELWGYREAHPMALSGGQKQRLAIAGALAAQKDIIFYDEPTSGLDYRNMERVAENIRRLSEMGKTQFVITHDPELVEKCCDRFLFFENGKITDSGSWTAEAVNQLRGYFESSSE